MAKYNIMILERISKNNLIVDVNKLIRNRSPGGNGETKKPKSPTTKDMLKEILATLRDHGNRLDGIEQRLGKHDERFDKIEKYIRL